ncbi:MAG TPA: oligosaccharide flippase family protein, partial [Kofleriaceae bacterium]
MLGLFDLVSTLLCLRFWVSTDELGAATLAAALFPILDRLGGGGLVSAVVREPDESPRAQSSQFWVVAGASAAVCAIACAARPLLGAWLPQPIIASLVAAYGGKQVLQSFGVVPEGMLKRALRYQELSMVRMIAKGVGTLSKLGFAWLGAHGVPDLRIWCFALDPIATAAVQVIGVQL